MTDPVPEPAGRVRAHALPGGGVRLYARQFAFGAEGQTGFDAEAGSPSSLDYLLAALAADLVAGLAREAARSGIAIDAAELSLSGWLDNPLVALGVVGEEGSAALAEVSGSMFVSSAAPEDALQDLWRVALGRAPVYSTLSRCARVRVALQRIP